MTVPLAASGLEDQTMHPTHAAPRTQLAVTNILFTAPPSNSTENEDSNAKATGRTRLYCTWNATAVASDRARLQAKRTQ